eukprot:g4676.t1
MAFPNVKGPYWSRHNEETLNEVPEARLHVKGGNKVDRETADDTFIFHENKQWDTVPIDGSQFKPEDDFGETKFGGDVDSKRTDYANVYSNRSKNVLDPERQQPRQGKRAVNRMVVADTISKTNFGAPAPSESGREALLHRVMLAEARAEAAEDSCRRYKEKDADKQRLSYPGTARKLRHRDEISYNNSSIKVLQARVRAAEARASRAEAEIVSYKDELCDMAELSEEVKCAKKVGKQIHKRFGVQLPDLPSKYADMSGPARTNWVIPDHVLVGQYPGLDGTRNDQLKDLEAILKAGMRTFVCVAEEMEGASVRNLSQQSRHQYVYQANASRHVDKYIHHARDVAKQMGIQETIKFCVFPIPSEGDAVPDPDKLTEFVADLTAYVRGGERLYIHCDSGDGRTAMVASILLSALYHIDSGESMERVQLYRHCRKTPRGQACTHAQKILVSNIVATLRQQNWIFRKTVRDPHSSISRVVEIPVAQTISQSERSFKKDFHLAIKKVRNSICKEGGFHALVDLRRKVTRFAESKGKGLDVELDCQDVTSLLGSCRNGVHLTYSESESILREMYSQCKSNGKRPVATGQALINIVQGLDVPGERLRETVQQIFSQMAVVGGDGYYRNSDGCLSAQGMGGDGRKYITLSAIEKSFNPNRDPLCCKGRIFGKHHTVINGGKRIREESIRHISKLFRDAVGGSREGKIPLGIWEDYHAALMYWHPRLQMYKRNEAGHFSRISLADTAHWRKLAMKGGGTDLRVDSHASSFRSLLWDMWHLEKADYVPVGTGAKHHHAPSQHQPLSAKETILKLRKIIRLGLRKGSEKNDGVRGLHELQRLLEAGASNNSDLIVPVDVFARIIGMYQKQHPKDLSVHPLTDVDITTLLNFYRFTSDGRGNRSYGRGKSVDGGQLYRDVQCEYTTKRRRLAEQAFNHLDVEKVGKLRRNMVLRRYNCAQHPDVLARQRTINQVKEEFSDCLGGSFEWVKMSDFDEYFSKVSGISDEDKYFEMVIQNCFELFGKKRGNREADQRGTSHNTGSHRRPEPATWVPHTNKSFLSTMTLAHGCEDKKDVYEQKGVLPHEEEYDPHGHSKTYESESVHSQEHLQELLKRFRKFLANRGVRGYFDLQNLFHSFRDHGAMSLQTFTDCIRNFGFSFSIEELRVLFDMVRSEKPTSIPGTIEVSHFLEVLRQGMSSNRRRIVQKVFAFIADIDITKVGDENVKADASLFHKRFNEDAHPDVLAGDRKAEDVRKEFRETFPHSGLLSCKDLETYYEVVSLTVPVLKPADNKWQLLLWKVWDLHEKPGDEAEWMKKRPYFGKNSMFSNKYAHRYAHHTDSNHTPLKNQMASNNNTELGGSNTHHLTEHFREEEKRVVEHYRNVRLHKAKTGVHKGFNCPTSYQYAAGSRPVIAGEDSRVGMHNHPEAMPRPKIDHTLVLQRLRRSLWQREEPGSLNLREAMEKKDHDGKRTLSPEDFLEVFKICNVGLSQKEADVLTEKYAFLPPVSGYYYGNPKNQAKRRHVIRYMEFLRELNGELSEWRNKILETAWAKIDERKMGYIDIDTLRRQFDPSFDPKVRRASNNCGTFNYKTSTRTKEQVLEETMRQFERYGKRLSKDEYFDYYLHKGACIEDDEYFQLLLWKEWQLAGPRGSHYFLSSQWS